MKAMVILRLYQIIRNIQSAGIVISILALFFSMALWIMGIQFLVKLDWMVFGILYFLLGISIHFYRKDHDWLNIHMTNPAIIKLIDYLLLSIPFLILYGCLAKWKVFLIVPVIATLLAYLPVRKVRNKAIFENLISRLIPIRYFELRSLFRRFPTYLLLLILSTLLSPMHISLLVIHGILWIMVLFNANQYVEPPTLIQYQNHFLISKIGQNLLLITILSIPVYLLSIIFHPDYWYFPLVHWATLLISTIFVIVNKYALYHPDQIIQSNSIQQALFLVFLFLPGLFIACIVWNIILYHKARKNLIYYYA